MSILNWLSGGVVGAVGKLAQTGVESITQIFIRKQEIKAADTERKSNMIRDKDKYNQQWDLQSLTNAGWKDDILFYAIIGMYVYSAFDPVSAAEVFKTWDTVIPEWFQKITFWLVASVIGVKKFGDYVPGAISGIKAALKS